MGFMYCVVGFMALIIIIQWFTNKWAIEERDWLRNRAASLMSASKRGVVAYSRLTDEYAQYRLERKKS